MGTAEQAIREDHPVNLNSAETLPTLPPERIRSYTRSLYDLGKGQAVAIVNRVDLAHVQAMLDIAGGSGIYSITFAQRQPTLRATVFDLPLVVPCTQEIIAHHSMQEHVTLCPGNYFQDDFTGGNDLVLLSNVLQTEAVDTGRMLLVEAHDRSCASELGVVYCPV
jgi:hypothetical protein